MRVSTEEFVRRAKLIHGDTYSYDQTIYINQKTPMKIFCNKCKVYFLQLPTNHLRGKGCKTCAIKKVHDKQRKPLEKFIFEAKKVHGNKYDYSEVNYYNNRDKVKIYCNSCNTYFWQAPDKHLARQDCPCFKLKKMHNKLKGSLQDFIEKAIFLFGNKYDYSKVDYYNSTTKVLLKCNKCNKTFYITPANHLRGRGCPYCKQSKGELQIEKWLNKNKILYIIQKRFMDCCDKNPLPFDFYLPDYNMCIEFQGKQIIQNGILMKMNVI